MLASKLPEDMVHCSHRVTGYTEKEDYVLLHFKVPDSAAYPSITRDGGIGITSIVTVTLDIRHGTSPWGERVLQVRRLVTLFAVPFAMQDKPDVRARLLVGADGLRSAIRATMVPQDPGPRCARTNTHNRTPSRHAYQI